MHRLRRVPSISLLLLCLLPAFGDRPAVAGEPHAPAPRLRMEPMLDGLRETAPGGDLAKLPRTDLYKRARRAGIDLADDPHPLLVASYTRGRLFYVFYKTVEGAVGDRPYIIQRIKKTVRDWTAGEAEPAETVTWQVEVFKTFAGALKRADRHYGSFGLRDHARREVIKEYEIGFGEVPGVCEGTRWPYDAGSLYRLLQGYQAERALYDDVRFSASRRWTLTVAFDDHGDWRVASPELGFDAPKQMPDAGAAAFVPDAATKDVVLLPGEGVAGLEIGVSREADIAQVLGEARQVVRSRAGNRNHHTPKELTVNVTPDGVVNTLITRTGFAGRTDRGVGIGAPRWAVMKAHGVPDARADAATWRYPGILFFFDGLERVKRIVVFSKDR